MNRARHGTGKREYTANRPILNAEARIPAWGWHNHYTANLQLI